MNEQSTKNKMGTEQVSKVMLSMGIPMILSMVLQACYNIVDSMFVARIPDYDGITHAGEYAVNALTLAFPVQMLIVAFGIGTGVGVNALLSKTLGENNKKKVAKIAGNGIMLGIIIYAVFFLFGLFGIDFYLKTQTSDPVILSMSKNYLRICTLLCLGIVMFSIYEKLLQATGKTLFSTIAQIAGAVTNIVLDPILIFGYLGLPSMGIAGAAYATVIGQMVSWIIAMVLHYKKNTEVESRVSYLKLDKKIVKEIYAICRRKYCNTGNLSGTRLWYRITCYFLITLVDCCITSRVDFFSVYQCNNRNLACISDCRGSSTGCGFDFYGTYQ